MMIFKTVELLERREGARSCLDDTCQCFLLAKNVLICSEDLVKDPSTDKGNAYEICRYKSSNQVIDTPEGNQRIHVSSSSKSAVSEGGMARPQRCQVRCMGPGPPLHGDFVGREASGFSSASLRPSLF